MTHPSDIAGLSERLRAQVTSDHVRGCEGRNYSCDCGYDLSTEGLLELAATALDSLSARVKELEANQERLWCSACGTVTRDRRCDCNRYGPSHEMYREPHFHNYADGLSADLEKVQTELDEAESRATRAEQQRDEAYERAAKVCDSGASAWDQLISAQHSTKLKHRTEGMAHGARHIAIAIRRLASGPEGGVKMEGK